MSGGMSLILRQVVICVEISNLQSLKLLFKLAISSSSEPNYTISELFDSSIDKKLFELLLKVFVPLSPSLSSSISA